MTKRHFVKMFRSRCLVCGQIPLFTRQFGTEREDNHRAYEYECPQGHITTAYYHKDCKDCWETKPDVD